MHIIPTFLFNRSECVNFVVAPAIKLVSIFYCSISFHHFYSHFVANFVREGESFCGLDCHNSTTRKIVVIRASKQVNFNNYYKVIGWLLLSAYGGFCKRQWETGTSMEPFSSASQSTLILESLQHSCTLKMRRGLRRRTPFTFCLFAFAY